MGCARTTVGNMLDATSNVLCRAALNERGHTCDAMIDPELSSGPFLMSPPPRATARPVRTSCSSSLSCSSSSLLPLRPSCPHHLPDLALCGLGIAAARAIAYHLTCLL